ncbi:MAG TPA: helix-turn-helix transcriptional regulator [Chitinophagaceae bacterium]|nr:helix-turn-helix transcriptional regulator [Chitinophagaceae bacterium]
MKNNLRYYREEKKLTQEELAKMAGVSRQSIISIEKGHYIPTSLLALKLSVVLKIKTEDLFILETKDWK